MRPRSGLQYRSHVPRLDTDHRQVRFGKSTVKPRERPCPSQHGSLCGPASSPMRIALQLTEAFPWNEAPRYLIRDRDRIYGTIVTRRLRAMGISDKPIAPASPWQNGFAERLIGSIRRECIDHFVVLSEAHLRRIQATWRAKVRLPDRVIRDWGTALGRRVLSAGQIEMLFG